VGHLLNGEATPQERASLTILWKYHVMFLDRSGAPDPRGLLPELRHVETNPALPLRLIVYHIGLVHHDHRLVHLLQRRLLDAVLVLLVDYVALLVEHAEALDLLERAPELQVVRELVLEQLLVYLVHRTEGTQGSWGHQGG